MHASDHDRFSIVAFASEPLRSRIEELRTRLPPSGRPILAPHVTIARPFVQPSDLDAIAARVRSAAARARVMTVRAGDPYDHTHGAFASVGIAVVAPPELAALHARVEEDLADLCAPLDPREDRTAFHPHLTVVQQVDPAAVPTIRAGLDALGPIPAFELRAAALVGRRVGGEWETLAVAPFGA
jgi:2'-5' RNA ligase